MKMVDYDDSLKFDNKWPFLPVVRTHGLTGHEILHSNRSFDKTWMFDDNEKTWLKSRDKTEYTEEDFSYRLNIHGFRCNDFNTMDFNKKSIVYLGCSFTFGIGLPEEHIWCSVLHKMIQDRYDEEFNFINLGVPGGSVDEYLRFIPWLTKFNTQMVITNNPSEDRALIVGSRPFICVPSHGAEPYYSLLTQTPQHFSYKFDLAINVLKSYCDAAKINFVSDSMVHDRLFINEEGKYARDGSHFGAKVHKEYAEILFKELTT